VFINTAVIRLYDNQSALLLLLLLLRLLRLLPSTMVLSIAIASPLSLRFYRFFTLASVEHDINATGAAHRGNDGGEGFGVGSWSEQAGK
jgi:hypothetical protein